MQIGIDIQDTERVASLSREHLERLFTKREFEYFEQKNWSSDTITGLFCAKEAFFKAIGTGLMLSRIREIEVLHNMKGGPYYKLSPAIIKENNLSTAKIRLSISHTKNTAVAVCLIIMIDKLIG